MQPNALLCHVGALPGCQAAFDTLVWVCMQLLLRCTLPGHGAGTYRLEFSGADPQVTPAKLQLRIVPCPSGYVTASTGDACSQCVRGYFSFNPSDKECTMCVPNAQCPGGAELYALRGFWSSAPKSQQIHR